MSYVDGMLAPVKIANRDEYTKFCQVMGGLFKECGALAVVDCWAVDVPDGKLNSMKSAVLLEEDETVLFSWIFWPSKEARAAGWEKAMSDPRMSENSDMPFDGSRLIYAEFEVVSQV